MDQLRALWKWLASWRKREWGPADYPLRYREQLPDSELEAIQGTLPRWDLQVVNWWQMGGLGDTQAEAFADFEARFAALREDGTAPPRPGRGLPLVFASSTIIERHEALARDFVSQILDLNYDECFISDESSLYDFVSSESEATDLVARIETHYSLTLLPRDGLLISELVEAIATERGSIPCSMSSESTT